MFDPLDPRWSGLEPIPQDDGPQPHVVSIMYTKEFSTVHGFFRAAMRQNEKSERTLELTSRVLTLNPANYTAWHFRRQCLQALNSDLEAELKWCAELAKESPKNYQLWHHRREICDKLNSPMNELKHIEDVLAFEDDAKNYHAWSHRQWVLTRFKQWDNELKYVDRLLHEDVKNNSAWNHRHFVITHTGGFTRERLREELEYFNKQVNKQVSNTSAWNYLIALSNMPFCDLDRAEALALTRWETATPCHLAGMFLLEIYKHKQYCDQLDCANYLPCTAHPHPASRAPQEKAREVCSKLIQTDPSRKRYWELRCSELCN